MGLMFAGHVRCLGRTGGGRLEEAIVDVCLLAAALLCQGGRSQQSRGLGCPLVPPPPQVSHRNLVSPEKGAQYLYF